jgi:hypothetical protein
MSDITRKVTREAETNNGIWTALTLICGHEVRFLIRYGKKGPAHRPKRARCVECEAVRAKENAFLRSLDLIS